MRISIKASAAQPIIPPAMGYDPDMYSDLYEGIEGGVKETRAALRQAEIIIRIQDERIRVLESLAQTDELTGLANRRGFKTAVDRELALARRDANYGGVAIMADLDNFKTVNDKFGHAAGDELLRIAAQVFCEGLRNSDFVARIGGDEFAILCPLMSESKGMQRLAKLERMFQKRTAELACASFIGVSFGLACYSGRETAESVMRVADLRMYRSKSGKRQVISFC